MLGDRACWIDGMVNDLANFEVGFMIREKLLPMIKALQFALSQATNIVSAVCRETASSKGPCCIDTSHVVIGAAWSVSSPIARDIEYVMINSNVDRLTLNRAIKLGE